MKAVSIAAICMLVGCGVARTAAQGSSEKKTSPAATRAAVGIDANLDRLQKETAARPDSIEGWWNLGTAAYDANRYDIAVSSLRRVVEAEPQMGIAWDLLGLSQFELKQFADAQTSLERADALGPLDDAEVGAVAAYHLGLLRIRDANFETAKAILQKHFGATPNPQAQLAMGLATLRVALLPADIDPSREALLLRVGSASAQGDSGLADFGRLVAENDAVPMLHLAYGEALENAGRTDDAIRQFRREAELSPQSAFVWKALSQAQQKHGDLQGAAAAANAAKFERQEAASEQRSQKWFAIQSIANGDDTLTNGMRAYASGRYAASVADLSAWVAAHPNDGTAWAVLGLSENKLADYANARVHLERGVSLGLQADAHAVGTARYTLGVLLLKTGEFERAAIELNAARTLSGNAIEVEEALGCVLLRETAIPQTPSDPITIAAGRIEAMLLESQYDQAFPAFRAMLASYPQQPNLHWAFGTALLALSEYDEAAEQMRDELTNTPNSALGYGGLASVALRQHRPAEAIQSAQRAVALSPDTAEPHYLLGRALLESGASGSKAVEELQRASQLNPNSPEVHYALAKAYTRESKPEEAARERGIFNRLNDVRQTQESGKADQTYAGPRQSEMLSGSSSQQSTPR